MAPVFSRPPSHAPLGSREIKPVNTTLMSRAKDADGEFDGKHDENYATYVIQSPAFSD